MGGRGGGIPNRGDAVAPTGSCGSPCGKDEVEAEVEPAAEVEAAAVAAAAEAAEEAEAAEAADVEAFAASAAALLMV